MTEWKERFIEDGLVERARTGDHHAFANLISPYKELVRKFIIRCCGDDHLADDICQEALLCAYRKLDLFETGTSFKNWLITIAMKLLNSHFRRSMNRREHPADPDVAFQDLVDGSSGQESDLGDTIEKVNLCVGKLTDKERKLLYLRYCEDLSHKEISILVGKTDDAVKQSHHKTMLKLRKMLGIAEDARDPHRKRKRP